MTNDKPAILVTGFIDIELWNEAKWRGCAFIGAPNGSVPPTLGFLFQNKTAGLQIFEQWHRRLGSVDRFDELRISIVEGDISGEEPG